MEVLTQEKSTSIFTDGSKIEEANAVGNEVFCPELIIHKIESINFHCGSFGYIRCTRYCYSKQQCK